jgi:hypothetical protein
VCLHILVRMHRGPAFPYCIGDVAASAQRNGYGRIRVSVSRSTYVFGYDGIQTCLASQGQLSHHMDNAEFMHCRFCPAFAHSHCSVLQHYCNICNQIGHHHVQTTPSTRSAYVIDSASYFPHDSGVVVDLAACSVMHLCAPHVDCSTA